MVQVALTRSEQGRDDQIKVKIEYNSYRLVVIFIKTITTKIKKNEITKCPPIGILMGNEVHGFSLCLYKFMIKSTAIIVKYYSLFFLSRKSFVWIIDLLSRNSEHKIKKHEITLRFKTYTVCYICMQSQVTRIIKNNMTYLTYRDNETKIFLYRNRYFPKIFNGCDQTIKYKYVHINKLLQWLNYYWIILKNYYELLYCVKSWVLFQLLSLSHCDADYEDFNLCLSLFAKIGVGFNSIGRYNLFNIIFDTYLVYKHLTKPQKKKNKKKKNFYFVHFTLYRSTIIDLENLRDK
ncbi:hypothetical protein AGLY_008797 [Aphis glycines]|uniref:Uncharacterized protein n=1 Tax=Aphis glycines TaxID=307491 RepID=A0A6G0TLU8_APHGL|nr:hypothetical protein AGLY_008797 [Aphis glycines]